VLLSVKIRGCCFFVVLRAFPGCRTRRSRVGDDTPVTEAPSWETAIELTTKTARQRQLRALLLVSLLEPIFEENAIEARCFAK
jgi:hypothetical protein